jgi:hypothetical protein
LLMIMHFVGFTFIIHHHSIKSVFYIDVIPLKERFPGVWQIPPETPCMICLLLLFNCHDFNMSLNWPLPECLHALVALSQSFPCLLKIRPDCRLSCAECREMRQASSWNDTDMSAVLCARPRNCPV